MTLPKERLAHLVELAAEPRARGELAQALAELLTAWPTDYPLEARPPFAALLARTEHDLEPEARRELAVKLAECNDAPLALLNEFFFELPAPARDRILMRDAAFAESARAHPVDERALIAAARTRRGPEFAHALAQALGIDALTAMEILQDASATGIAIACRGAGLSRAAFSTLVVLTARADAARRLVAFENVPERGAATMLAFWRRQAMAQAHARAA